MMTRLTSTESPSSLLGGALVLVLVLASSEAFMPHSSSPRRHLLLPSSSRRSSSSSRGGAGLFGLGAMRKQRRRSATTSSSSSSSSSSSTEVPAATQVAVVGAGVSGLVCARRLAKAGVDVAVFEASDGVGGRVRTDVHEEGFLLDRGFQVFIEEYPAVKRELSYESLNLEQFRPGALVRAGGGLATVADPFRRPQDIVAGVLAPVGSLVDKVKVGLYRLLATQVPLASIFAKDEVPTYDFLRSSLGLSDEMVDRFFRPFYQGIYLAPLEEQSSRMFEFVFQMFATGAAALPEGGLQAVPDQLARDLEQVWKEQKASGGGGGGDDAAATGLFLSSPVKSVGTGGVVLADGRKVAADHVVVATDGPAAARLLESLGGGGGGGLIEAPVDRSSTCVYFAIDGPPPVTDPILILNGEAATAQRPVNNICFPSAVQPGYAPKGKSLASVTVVDACVGGLDAVSDSELAARCQAHIAEWFAEEEGGGGGGGVSSWRFLRSYRIKHSQPGQDPATAPGRVSFEKQPEVAERVYCCGDHRSTATLNGAFESGANTAAVILKSSLKSTK